MNNMNYNHTVNGTLTYQDLNRIESAVLFLSEKLAQYSYPVTVQTKTNWTRADFPTRAEIDRIRRNIVALHQGFYGLPDWKEVIYNNTLDFEQVNVMEWDLSVINVWLDRMIAVFKPLGTFYLGEE